MFGHLNLNGTVLIVTKHLQINNRKLQMYNYKYNKGLIALLAP